MLTPSGGSPMSGLPDLRSVVDDLAQGLGDLFRRR